MRSARGWVAALRKTSSKQPNKPSRSSQKIWRRRYTSQFCDFLFRNIQVRGASTLRDFHTSIQVAFSDFLHYVNLYYGGLLRRHVICFFHTSWSFIVFIPRRRRSSRRNSEKWCGRRKWICFGRRIPMRRAASFFCFLSWIRIFDFPISKWAFVWINCALPTLFSQRFDDSFGTLHGPKRCPSQSVLLVSWV